MHAYAKFDLEDLKVMTLSVYILGVNTWNLTIILMRRLLTIRKKSGSTKKPL